MPGTSRTFIFLSYASENLDMVREVYAGLIHRNLDVWFDKERLGAGEWYPQVMKAISRSKYFVICISEAALRKVGDEPGFQDEELTRAYEIAMKQPGSEFTIVPVRIEDCDRGDHRLSTFQQYDLFEDFEKGLDRLAVDMGGKSLSHTQAKDERTEDEKIIENLFGKAVSAHYSGEYEKAITIWDAILTFKPGMYEAWNNKGNALMSLGRHEEALLACDKAIDMKPDKHQAWSNKGNTFGKLGRYEEALSAYENAIKLKPESHEAWFSKGNTLLNLCRCEEAVAAYDKAIELKPDYHEAWNNKGSALGKLGRHEDAFSAIDI